jgi:prevent-host-death family protein
MFRENLARTLRRVAGDGEYIVVTRRGAPVAVVVPMGVLDLIDATEALLARRTLAAAGDLHDEATASADVPRRVPSGTSPNGRPVNHPARRGAVPRPG